jgi:hypothetical protein
VQKITAEYIKAFIGLNNVPCSATQSRICIPIILRMCRKMAYGIKFDEIKVCDNMIIDGHHRYLSSLIMKFELAQVITNSTSATKAIDWTKVEFDDDDWDTPAKIAYLNKLDASYNGLEIDFLEQIISRK